MRTSDPTTLTLTEAGSLLRRRALSPVELTDALLARIGRLDGAVQAFVSVLTESARADAGAAERALRAGEDRGPLHGLPVALKDLVDVAGAVTAAGSPLLAHNVAAEDAGVTARLRAAGAVVLGKTHTHEFAYGVQTPPTRNPWDLARIPGGSSGGSAAAVAARLCPAAVGTDTGGSVRIPAALCGVAGLKPTYGRISQRGILPLAPSLDQPGPLARTVADLALLLTALAGHDPADPTTADVPVPAYSAALAQPVAGLRLGVVRALFAGAEPSVAAAVEAALHVCAALGMACREILLPGLARLDTGSIIYAESAAYHRTRFGHPPPGAYSTAVAGYLAAGERVLALTYLQARAGCAAFRAECVAALREVDLLVAPTVPIAAPRTEQTTVTLAGQDTPTEVVWPLLRNCSPFNAAGLPALSVPCGFTSDGLPVGLQLVGRLFDEGTVLCAGHAYEREVGWWQHSPALDTGEPRPH